MELQISVRQLVEFILRDGDIDNRRTGGTADAMQEGSRIHRMIQKRMGVDYKAEVPLKFRYYFSDHIEDHISTEEVLDEDTVESDSVVIEGRADGIIDQKNGKTVVIDEIKGTYKELHRIKEAVPVHLAQAKCYAYIYATQNDLEEIAVRMTYCNMDSEEIKYFQEKYTYEEIKKWFLDLMKEYKKWADFQIAWDKKRTISIKELPFPFAYREGQKELAASVYRTIYHKKKLFIEAPTGVGKTISTAFPAVKAMGEGLVEKIFYLTAKTITRTVAENTFQLLKEHGLSLKTVTITAKEKICPLEEMDCNPESCPYALGHYDRINDAMYDLLIHEDNFQRETIEEYAKKHQVCPFEMCLDMSLYADAIICDYNYVFDPKVYLKRFFGDNLSKNYVFLIDEAHNLVDRGREMYSAALIKEDFLELKRLVKEESPRIAKNLDKCNKEMLTLKKECTTYKKEELIAPLVNAVTRLYAAMDDFLDEHDSSPNRKEILDLYFTLSHFLNIYEIMDGHYITYSQILSSGDFSLKLFCVNPTLNLMERMKRGRSTILFSATFLPIQYYKSLLGAEEGDYEIYATSAFQEEKKALLLASDVTSKYARRSESEYRKIAHYIYQIVTQRYGNYMVFLPSYAFLQRVYEIFEKEFFDETIMECILQEERMSEQDREAFLNHFQGNEESDISEHICMDIEYEEEKCLIGFCVMGGIFSEGIDLKNDSLIGAVIVGTGLPQVCSERELLKEYFDGAGENGYDYAYRYPGMNKVLQSAGRVIRTAEDVGVVALLDERFLDYSYQRMFPREWKSFEIIDEKNVEHKVSNFWNEWL